MGMIGESQSSDDGRYTAIRFRQKPFSFLKDHAAAQLQNSLSRLIFCDPIEIVAAVVELCGQLLAGDAAFLFFQAAHQAGENKFFRAGAHPDAGKVIHGRIFEGFEQLQDQCLYPEDITGPGGESFF